MGRMIRILMQVRGRTVADLMPVLDRSDQQVRDRLNGRVAVSSYDIERLAEYLDVPPGDFFRDPDDLVKHMTGWSPVDPGHMAYSAVIGHDLAMTG